VSYSKTKKVRLSKYDALWSRMVRERDGACLYCGRKDYLQAHHFKGRSCKATRLMLENGVTLCSSHHTFNYQFSAHRTPEAFAKWFKKTFPDRHKVIVKKAQQMMSERLAIQEFTDTYLDDPRRTQGIQPHVS
jgi:5-methylcytosine-specific restriction endonuclease McrA